MCVGARDQRFGSPLAMKHEPFAFEVPKAFFRDPGVVLTARSRQSSVIGPLASQSG